MKYALIAIAGLLGLLPLGQRASSHDFHLSKCLLRYNEAEATLQISLHIFLDDLEEALRRQGADKLFLGTEKEATAADKHLLAYLRQHLRFALNGQQKDYVFLGKELSDDLQAIWCYLEIRAVRSTQELEITNSILLEVFDDQKNLVSVKRPGGKEGVALFSKGNTVKRVAL